MWGSNPPPTLTGEWLMTMVHDILKQIPGLGQPQRKFLATLFVTILVLRGRVNFRHLSRYCDYAERTIARQFREPFDWPDFGYPRNAGHLETSTSYREGLMALPRMRQV